MRKERLDKVLANMGVGTRKEVKEMIKAGMVTINGNIVKAADFKVNVEEDEIICGGQMIRYREFVYLMMNKPHGMVSSTDDPRDSTVIELLDDFYKNFRPFPVGRLDKDTEGLLLITNDGKLAHDLLSPKKKVGKTYYATIDGALEEEHVEIFKKGILLEDGYTTLPAELKILSSGVISVAEITIQEGKYHQVKRMIGALGMRVSYLKRIRMGPISLDESLEPGQYRELTEEEITSLLNR
ncbi:pseudouridine synthase [Gudongella sp. DL1XJH-153]|uniref:pseudouridine synthase n=1 Tax=Gudongella sp. DL1XJH-153 TaxID=3409804 RepID=UPI003BB54680